MSENVKPPMSTLERAIRWRDVWSPFWWRVVFGLFGLSALLLVIAAVLPALP